MTMNLIIENSGKPMVMVGGKTVPEYKLWKEKDILTEAKVLISNLNLDGMVYLLLYKTPFTSKIVKMCRENNWKKPLEEKKVIKAIEELELIKEGKKFPTHLVNKATKEGGKGKNLHKATEKVR